MIDKDVTQLSELFGIQKEIVEASEKDGTLSVRISDALSKKKMFTDVDFETFKKNHATEVTTNYFNDLVEKAKKQDLPQDLYKPIRGAVLQQTERELSQKYGVSEFSGISDLVEKVVSKTTATGKTLPEYEKQINDLKTANLKLVQEKDQAIQSVESKYRTQALERDKIDSINKVPFDFSAHKPAEVDNVRMKTQNILKSVFDAEYKLDYDDKQKIVVTGKDGKVIRNQATLDPVSPLDVMIDLAKDYNLKLSSPDKGGQGGKSSSESGLGFTDADSFMAFCAAKGIMPTSSEGIKLWKASGLKQ